MLFWQDIRAAASRTFCTAGSKSPIRTAMMAMTTNNSIRVNPSRFGRCAWNIANSIKKGKKRRDAEGLTLALAQWRAFQGEWLETICFRLDSYLDPGAFFAVIFRGDLKEDFLALIVSLVASGDF